MSTNFRIPKKKGHYFGWRRSKTYWPRQKARRKMAKASRRRNRAA